MPAVRLVSNTTKDYPCTMCGSPGNIVREDEENPRLKCTSCEFMYDAKDSIAAKEAGMIPDGPPPPPPEDPPLEEIHDTYNRDPISDRTNDRSNRSSSISIPRTPGYILLSKNRRDFEFATEKDFKKKLLKWEASDTNYDVYKLEKFEYSVNIDLKS